ncbi:MAG: transglycosylase SLT domain-containing protein [Bacteroidales bacterium]|nr:transglycosylase SLT domain-containing protein [Bacteroidales bacterium]
MKFFLNALCFLCGFLCLVGCNHPKEVVPEPIVEEEPIDTLTALDHLQERGTLRAVTQRQHLNYRLIEGRPSGFQFELLDDFCEDADLKLNLLVNDSLEECYRMLSEGSVDLFAGEVDSVDLLDSTYFHLILKTPVALDKTIAWVIPNHDGDSSLFFLINLWMDDFQKKDMKSSFYRYFPGGRSKTVSETVDSKHISPYDALIKTEAERIHWDWRLLSSIIYQESRFKPDLESDVGAYGLMQLMPIVMETYDIDYDSPPEDQLVAGGKLLLHIDHELPECISDSLERQKFILASYNAGLGNVLEARKKAEKQGKDPNLWDDNVERYMPRQTYRFVKDVLKRYSHYQALIEP